MIFLFRKEIKKWNTIWWFVLASLAFGFAGGSFFAIRQPNKNTIKVASVDGYPITLNMYQYVHGELKSSLDDLAVYWGMPVERLAMMMGVGNIGETSLNRCIQNVLLDTIWGDFAVRIDTKSFQNSLAATMSKAFIDSSGSINMQAYQNYLSRLHMTIKDFEAGKELEFKRTTILRALNEGAYLPKYIIDAEELKKNEKKQFQIIVLPASYFVEKETKNIVDEENLKRFFTENRDLYKVAEKRKVNYVLLTPEDYAKKVEIEEELIERFYEKNKSSLYRIPPKVKIRTILLKDSKEKAQDVHDKLIQAPEKFAELAKKYSEDSVTAKNGGLMDFFNRGTHDPELERVAFLKLKEPGDISDIIKTERGFEIIKLEERVAAEQKPLATVKAEIVKTLIDRKAIISLQGDLESVIRTSSSDKNIFEKFTDSNKLAVKDTGWISKGDVKSQELLDALIQKIFTENSKTIGFFVHEGKHVLYKVIEKQESYIPEFISVKEKIRSDFVKKQAEEKQKEMVKNLRSSALRDGAKLETLATENGLKLITTKLLATDGEITEIKDKNLVGNAFILNDQSQVLLHKHESEYYLVKLVASSQEENKKEKATKEATASQVISQQKRRYLDGFVASLMRNAKIEIDSKMLKEAAVN